MGEEASSFIRRNKAEPFFLMLSFTAVHTPMEATPEDLAEFPELSGKRQTIAAMNLAMDRAVGEVLSTLDQTGLTENTLVVFTDDNGGPSDTNASDNYPLSGTKANHLEGGIRVPMLIRWPSVIKPDRLGFSLTSKGNPMDNLKDKVAIVTGASDEC